MRLQLTVVADDNATNWPDDGPHANPLRLGDFEGVAETFFTKKAAGRKAVESAASPAIRTGHQGTCRLVYPNFEQKALIGLRLLRHDMHGLPRQPLEPLQATRCPCRDGRR